MKIGTAFKSNSNTLKQEDIGSHRPRVIIDRVEIEMMGQGEDSEEKPVLYFQGKDKGLALNRTNAETLTAILGTDETDEWAGHAIVLYVDKSVMYAGKRVGGVRIAAAAQVAARRMQPVAAPPPPPAEEFVATDEDVPF